MSKYDALWNYVANRNLDSFLLSFDEIEALTKTGIDHSFLTYKKELLAYGFRVAKISMKNQTVEFVRCND